MLSACDTSTELIAVDSVVISTQNLYLATGQAAVISAQVYPFNALNQDVDWFSTNTSVVTVDDGFVSAKNAGEATIYVISKEGHFSDECKVLVTTASENLAITGYRNMNKEKPENYYSIANKSVYDLAESIVTVAKARKEDGEMSTDRIDGVNYV